MKIKSGISLIHILIFLLLLPNISIGQRRANKEVVYQNEFSKKLTRDSISNETEVTMNDRTRCDIVTDTFAIEVDFANKWAESIGQSLHYSLLLGKKPCILLIMESVKDVKYLNRLKLTAVKYDITVWTVSKDFEFKLRIKN